MDAAEALAFARKNPRAVLATMKRDGTPQLSPVLVGVDSQDRLVISTRETAMKTLNVRRNPRAWLCVLNDRFFGDWAQLSGDARTVEELEQLHRKTGLSKTDIVNRAISLYAFVTEQLDSGQDLLVRDRKSGEVQRIQLF